MKVSFISIKKLRKHSVLLLFSFGMLCVFFLGISYSPSIPFKPNFPALTPLIARQQAFVDFMVPKIVYANDQILQTRAQIQNLVQNWSIDHSLSYSERSWLDEIATVYQVNNFNINDSTTIETLLSRVDAIPASLVLAQAANESGWGTSRFAVEADNFFGQHCNVPGCGVTPFERPGNEIYEVQKFKNVQSAIDDYLYNINTNPSYASLRAMRAELRAHKQPLTGFRLAPFLINYSILGQKYALLISGIIVDHNLLQYDAINDDILQ